MPMASMALMIPVPSTAMMPMASRIAGNANSTSMQRMISPSFQPPKKPAISPAVAPISSASATEMTPTSSETCAPNMMRRRMSRPNSPVPKMKYSFGGNSFQFACVSSAPYGASSGAASAMSTQMHTMMAPLRPIRLRKKRLASVADARIEPGIHQVHGQIDQTENQSDEQHPTLHNGVIAIADAVEQEAAHARQRENRLDNHRAAEQVADLHADDGQHRNECVFQRMPIQHTAIAQAFGIRGADVVLAEHLQQAGADHAHDERGHRRAQCNSRQDQGLQTKPRVVQETDKSDRWKPVQPERDKQDEQGAQPEIRNAESEECHHP